ncbi:PREDICTED: cytochrome P450 76C4-like [Tarenaya hassleriana]|uniref:cytochrome P450 76C4-like n=1 Tax=Tarenaya hassleriana TaxID=28532 RepID=UPI00053C9691|nr:PREDICTED: cytochrome P450 76C4-like [Tarenaya hassleriana]
MYMLYRIFLILINIRIYVYLWESRNPENREMDISAPALFLLVCFLLSCFFVFATAKSRSSSGGSVVLPPGPPPLPIIGNILHFGKNPHRSIAELSKTYGPVMSLKLGTLNTVVVSSPEAAKEVLQTHDHVLSARTSPNSARAIGYHDVSVVWMPPSALWRQLRKISASQLFSPQRLEATKTVRMKKVKELMSFLYESCERGEAVDIARASFVTSLNIVSNALFSADFARYDSKESHDYHDLVVRVTKSAGKPDIANFFPFLGFLDLQGSRKEFKVCTDRLLKVFQGLIDDRFRERLNRTEPRDGSRTDLLDSLLDLNQDDESELNMNVIKSLLLDLFGAGTDTKSSTVEWAMAELLRNPTKMTKVQTEIGRVIGENVVFDDSDIQKLPYLQAVVKETLRLHPPVPFLIPRKAQSDARIFEFFVPKNAQVLVNVWTIGRDSSVWENPTQFEPERFLGSEIDVKGKDFELIPFGAGRRICPGMPMAFKTVPMMLVSLLHSFDWKLQNGAVPEELDMEEAFGVTLHKAQPLYAVPVMKRVGPTSSAEI